MLPPMSNPPGTVPSRPRYPDTPDCLLEEARDRTPRLWMLAKDRYPTRTYLQLLTDYRRDPAAVDPLLPHRPPSRSNRCSAAPR